MKNLRFKIYTVLAFSLLISSCTEDLAELDKNTNAYETVNAKFLVTKSQLATIGANPNGKRFNIMQQMEPQATYSEVTAPGNKYFAEGYVRNNWAVIY